MQFLNMAQGDAPYFKQLAEQYALSDNFHQSVMGGTGANHIMLGFGDAIYYADANGDPATPPENQIENPNAQSGTNNWWVQDGYSGGSYVNCADDTQPGVAAVKGYLKSLPYRTFRGTGLQSGCVLPRQQLQPWLSGRWYARTAGRRSVHHPADQAAEPRAAC